MANPPHRSPLRRLQRRFPAPGLLLAGLAFLHLVAPIAIISGLLREAPGLGWLYPPFRWLWFGLSMAFGAVSFLALFRGRGSSASGASPLERLSAAMLAITALAISAFLYLDRLVWTVVCSHGVRGAVWTVSWLVRGSPADALRGIARVATAGAVALGSAPAALGLLVLDATLPLLVSTPLAIRLRNKPSRDRFVAETLAAAGCDGGG